MTIIFKFPKDCEIIAVNIFELFLRAATALHVEPVVPHLIFTRND